MNDTRHAFYLEELPIACSYHELIFDENRQPIDFSFIYTNEGYGQLFKGFAPGIHGKRLGDLYPAGSELFEKWLNIATKSVLGGTAYEKVVFEPNSKTWILTQTVPVSSTNFIIFFLPMQEEDRNKIQIEGFFLSNLDLMYIAKKDWHFVRVNREFQHTFGHHLKDYETASFLDYVHPEDLASTHESLSQLNTEYSLIKFTNHYRCKDESYKAIEWKAHMIGDLIFSTGRDISEMLRLQEDLEKRNTELNRLTGELLSMNESLEHIAHKDNLTKLYNRYYFDQKLSSEMERSDRYDEPLSMLLFDLDHFKRVNDTYGHPVGDEVLFHTAQIFQNVIRETDLAFRIGGEEFCLLMPHTKLAEAYLVAEKIRHTIEQNPHPKVGGFTASFGVAQRFKAETYKSWYNRTDLALYHSKEHGRNQVTIASKDALPVATVEILWNECWDSGNPKIDSQHREILEKIRALFESAYANPQSELLLTEVNSLLEHIRYHFATEISILQAVHYPDALHHEEIHTHLLHKANALMKDYSLGNVKAMVFFSYLLDELVLEHMVNEDTKFFSYLETDKGTAF